MTIKNFTCNDNLAQYTDSMLFDSGECIAEMECEINGHNIEIYLEVRGEVDITYKEDRYKYPSDFPEELKELIKNHPNLWELEDDDVYIDMNNWFEYIYDDTVNGKTYSDGVMFESDLSVCTADDIKKEMIEIAEWIAGMEE